MCRLLSLSMLWECMAPPTPVVMTSRRLIFQPFALIAIMSGLYLLVLVLMAWLMFLSCVYLNSIVCICSSGLGSSGPLCSSVARAITMVQCMDSTMF